MIITFYNTFLTSVSLQNWKDWRSQIKNIQLVQWGQLPADSSALPSSFFQTMWYSLALKISGEAFSSRQILAFIPRISKFITNRLGVHVKCSWYSSCSWSLSIHLYLCYSVPAYRAVSSTCDGQTGEEASCRIHHSTTPYLCDPLHRLRVERTEYDSCSFIVQSGPCYINSYSYDIYTAALVSISIAAPLLNNCYCRGRFSKVLSQHGKFMQSSQVVTFFT